MLARAAILAFAILAGAWFVLGIRQNHAVDQATSILSASTKLTAAEGRHVDSLLNEAKTLNPDRTVELLRGQLAAARGSNARADQIFTAITRQEPDNIEAWAWLGRTAVDRRVLLRAYGHMALLDPLVSFH